MRVFEDLEKAASEAENQYALTLAIAKRVKHLKSGAPTLSDVDPQARPFEAAYAEFTSGLVTFRLPDEADGKAGDEVDEPESEPGAAEGGKDE